MHFVFYAELSDFTSVRKAQACNVSKIFVIFALLESLLSG